MVHYYVCSSFYISSDLSSKAEIASVLLNRSQNTLHGLLLQSAGWIEYKHIYKYVRSQSMRIVQYSQRPLLLFNWQQLELEIFKDL